MKISYNWLKQYINIDLPPKKIAELLTDTGLEVESVEEFQSVKGGLEGLVIGEVKTCSKHPNAEKLSLTTVEIANGEILPIVCGAPNVAAGQKVVVATVGTTLYAGKEELQIKKSKIRGEVSEGMICAEDEIGLGDSHAGIIVLPADTQVGMLAKDYFNVESDWVFEIGLTPNRIDGASHFGVARDLAASVAHLLSMGLINVPEKTVAKLPQIPEFKADNHDYRVEVEIAEPEGCFRYCGLTITGVEVKDSPTWLQNKLKAIGMTPINNVVDITNFVLHETGQPLHGFDADRIGGKKVVVKTLAVGTKFTTLDQVERTLAANDLMICDANEGMVIAGVFGGLKSGVTSETKNIFLESAWFNPAYIRRSSKRHGLYTDSSFRFERGTDTNQNIYALLRAAYLIKEIAGGTFASEIVDVYPRPVAERWVDFSFANCQRLIGKAIDNKTIIEILKSLDFVIENQTDTSLKLKVPNYRVDVTREADVVEEILRIYGYNNVEFAEKVNSTLSYISKPDTDKIKNTISNLLSSNGFNEAMSNSLSNSEYYKNRKAISEENTVLILNPVSIELNAMRQTLLFGGLENVMRNIHHRSTKLKMYEFGFNYFKNKGTKGTFAKEVVKNYVEEFHLGLWLTGEQNSLSWNTAEKMSDFYDLKGYVDLVLKRLGFDIDNLKVNELDSTNDLFSFGISYRINNKIVVDFGKISKQLHKEFDIQQDVFYADFNWDNVCGLLPADGIYSEIPKYPFVKRDLALLVDENVTFAQLKEIAESTDKKLIKNVSIFDVYKGKQVEEGKKSYALNFVIQDDTKTLNDKQIAKIMSKIATALEREVGAKVRS